MQEVPRSCSAARPEPFCGADQPYPLIAGGVGELGVPLAPLPSFATPYPGLETETCGNGMRPMGGTSDCADVPAVAGKASGFVYGTVGPDIGSARNAACSEEKGGREGAATELYGVGAG